MNKVWLFLEEDKPLCYSSKEGSLLGAEAISLHEIASIKERDQTSSWITTKKCQGLGIEVIRRARCFGETDCMYNTTDTAENFSLQKNAFDF